MLQSGQIATFLSLINCTHLKEMGREGGRFGLSHLGCASMLQFVSHSFFFSANRKGENVGTGEKGMRFFFLSFPLAINR